MVFGAGDPLEEVVFLGEVLLKIDVSHPQRNSAYPTMSAHAQVEYSPTREEYTGITGEFLVCRPVAVHQEVFLPAFHLSLPPADIHGEALLLGNENPALIFGVGGVRHRGRPDIYTVDEMLSLDWGLCFQCYIFQT